MEKPNLPKPCWPGTRIQLLQLSVKGVMAFHLEPSTFSNSISVALIPGDGSKHPAQHALEWASGGKKGEEHLYPNFGDLEGREWLKAGACSLFCFSFPPKHESNKESVRRMGGLGSMLWGFQGLEGHDERPWSSHTNHLQKYSFYWISSASELIDEMLSKGESGKWVTEFWLSNSIPSCSSRAGGGGWLRSNAV